ncbi:TIGR00725 family protein [Chloroflexota bacterium]
MPPQRGIYVAVVGSAICDEQTAAIARVVGRELARKGVVLVCGGRGGVMEAACRGAKEGGGTTLGILPGTEPGEANEYVDVEVVTGLGEARNAIVVRTADAIIAIGGGWGTLSEIGLALKMGRPVVGLGTWQLVKEGQPVDAVAEAGTPDHAVRAALSLAAARLGLEEENA